MLEDFCMNFYTTVEQSNIHFITKFGWNLLENDKLMLFQPRQPSFLSIPSVVFTGSLLVSLKRASLLVMIWGCRLANGQSYCKCLEWPPLAATYSHVGSRVLGEDRHRLVHVFLWQLFPNGLQSDFQLISCLMLRLEFIILFQMWQSIGFKSGELEGHSCSLLNEPVRIQSVLHDVRQRQNYFLCKVSLQRLLHDVTLSTF